VLNLLTDSWLPVIRRQTGRCVIRAAQITEAIGEDPVIAIDWPRPDFRIATLEFLIGLLTTIVPPRGGDEWLERWSDPPDPATLDAVFARFTHAFVLDGNGPRFLQDFEDLQSGPEPIERLLIEAPGDATVSKNTDLLVHRDRVSTLGRAAAAMALYTFQSWAPAGGAGNRTGLRGGGPLITMIMPGERPTLWHILWANVPTDKQPPAQHELPLVFPWLAPTMVSDGNKTVTPQMVHELQCWWGMPRRIRLDFTVQETPRPCDLTGVADSVHATSWRQRPRGANYAVWGRVHPLTPHYQQKANSEWLPVHPQPGGIGYRHWFGLVLRSEDGLRLPASTVSSWYHGHDRDVGVRNARLLAAGFDMDNMKARGFVESEMPLPGSADEETQDRLDALARCFVKSADQVASLLRTAVRNALFSTGATVQADITVLAVMRERLWEETEGHFFNALEAVSLEPAGDIDHHQQNWLKHLRQTALSLFDEAAPLSADSGDTMAQRIGKARRLLGFALHGYGPAGAVLFVTLERPPVEIKEPRRKRKAA